MTASLHIVKGATPGEVPLGQERIVLGRNPDCNVVIPVTSVSREHAQIVRVGSDFFIEDLKSRNKTFVNNEEVTDRRLLKHNDKIRICDFQATFHDARKPLPKEWTKEADEEPGEDEGGATTVEATMLHNSSLLLDQHPSEKLRSLLEISSNLSQTLELDRLLPKIVDSLFQLFKQADRCFIILAEEGTGRLLPKVTKTRRPQDETNARFSKSIVRQCLESKKLFLSNNADSDKRILSQSVVDFRIRSVMCGPLIGIDGNPFGVIQLDTQDRSKKFTEQEDLPLLGGVASQASIALENAKMYRDMQVRARIERDLHLAEEVQRGFLPQQLPQVPGYEFFAHYEPAQEVGGDYYGFVPLGGNRLAFSVGDVAGKGVAAALLMAKLSSDVRYCLLSEGELAKAIAKLNDLVHLSAGQMDRFITLAAAVLDAEAHTVTLVNAGHVVPLLYREATATVEDAMPKEAGGLPMGILDGQDYSTHQLSLAPGDCLLLVSDGVTDAVSARGDSFGVKGIHTALKGEALHGARAVGERIVKAVKLHAAGRPQGDDITLMCVGRAG